MNSTLARLFNLDNVPQITFEDLSQAKGLDRIALDPGIHTTSIPLYEKKSLLFLTEMSQGSQFLHHSHDCKEIITIVRGELMVLGNTYGPGEKIVVYANIGHSPLAVIDSLLYVEFLRPTKNNK